MQGAIARAEELAARDPERGHPAAVREPGQSGNPPPHHGRGDLERHRRQDRHLRRRRRHRRHHHRRRPGAEAAQAVAARSSRSSRRKARCCRAASPDRTRSRASAPASCPDILDRSVIDEIVTVDNATAFEFARARRARGGHPGRHLVRRRDRRRHQIGGPAGDGGQDDRRDRAVLRRALSVDRAVRGLLIRPATVQSRRTSGRSVQRIGRNSFSTYAFLSTVITRSYRSRSGLFGAAAVEGTLKRFADCARELGQSATTATNL